MAAMSSGSLARWIGMVSSLTALDVLGAAAFLLGDNPVYLAPHRGAHDARDKQR